MWCVIACADGVCVVLIRVNPLITGSRPFYLYPYIGIENRWTCTRFFGVPTAQLCPLSVQLATGMISCTRASGASKLRKWRVLATRTSFITTHIARVTQLSNVSRSFSGLTPRQNSTPALSYCDSYVLVEWRY